MRKFFHHPLVWIVLISVLPTLPWFVPGMPFVHDGQDHVARVANFYAALKEGIIVPRWGANLNWGYGHPILMFLYPLPEYIASLFHFVGFTLVDATKLVFVFSYIAAGLAMYLWMKEAYGVRAGLVGALLYQFAPYRFVDLSVRGAFGEHVAFVFPPLAMFTLLGVATSVNKMNHERLKINGKRQKQTGKMISKSLLRNAAGLSLSIAGLILSHNAMALMFLPVIGLYALYLLIFEVNGRLLFTPHRGGAGFIAYCLLSLALGFSLSAFFWIPALVEGKYTLRYIVTAGEALTHFVLPLSFVYSPWNYGGTDTLTKSLGYTQWIGVVLSIVLVFKSRVKKQRIVLVGLAALLFTSFFIQTAWSAPVWNAGKILQNFQFPWRFLSVSVFISAVLGGIALGQKTVNKKLFIAYCLLSIVVTINMWFPKGYQIHDESFYTGIYPGTTDTGESSPIWSTRFMEHTAAAPLEVVDGEATITPGKRTTTVHEYTLDVKKPTLMMENTVYFPGWKIYLDGEPADIQFQNPDYRGLMLFRVTEGIKNVRVVFENTRVRTVSNFVSLAALAVLAGLGGFVWRKNA